MLQAANNMRNIRAQQRLPVAEPRMICRARKTQHRMWLYSLGRCCSNRRPAQDTERCSCFSAAHAAFAGDILQQLILNARRAAASQRLVRLRLTGLQREEPDPGSDEATGLMTACCAPLLSPSHASTSVARQSTTRRY